MRPVELVRRAEEDVCIRRRDVDRPVRAVVDGVDPRERAGLVCDRGDLGDGCDRAHGVRGPWIGDDARALVHRARALVELEAAVVVHARKLHHEAAIVRELEPGRDVAVVVELGADDLVAFAPVARRSPRKREVERRHVRAEGDLVDGRVDKVGRGRVRSRDERVGAPRRLERAAEVRVGLAQVAADRVDHRVRHLRAARSIEEREVRWSAVNRVRTPSTVVRTRAIRTPVLRSGMLRRSSRARPS